MPKISIILAVYNVEPYLKRSLDSLMNQTMKDLEFICIDDCSTDNSLAVLKEYEAKDSRFKIIASDKNYGAAIARNKGLEVACGEYLGFIDPDDDIDLNYYEELYKRAKEADYDIVKCSIKTIKQDGTITKSNLNNIIRKNGIYFFFQEWTTAIYKSSIIFENNIKFPSKIRKSQDTAFLSRIVLKSKTISLIDDIFYYYYKREGSLDASKLPINSLYSALQSKELVCDEINKSDLYESDKNSYILLYKIWLKSILNSYLFRNKSFKARLLCADSVINSYNKCKDIKALNEIFEYKWMLKYIHNKNKIILALLLILYRNKKQLLHFTPLEQIFSVKNLKMNNKKFKTITLFCVKISFRIKEKKSG